MRSCRIGHYMLLLLLLLFITESESDVPAVKVKLHGSATLSCSERCSGLVRWTVFSKPKDTLAECDQTSCRSVKEGYQMIHHQYLNGDLSLTITDVDFSKRARYTCDCDGKDLCDVKLQIEPVESELELDAGERLEVDLHISESVVIMMTRPDAPGTVPLCSVDGRQYQCLPEYQSRILIIKNSFILMDVAPSDSGNYTVEEKDNTPISISRVTVRDVQDSWVWKSGYERGYQKGSSDGYQKGMGTGALSVVFVALVLLIVVFVGGVLAAPRARPLMNRCVNMLRYTDSSRSDQMQDMENGRPLRSDSASPSSE